MQESVGSRFEGVYKNTHLKQERGMQIEAIREEVFQAFAGEQISSETSDLMATAIEAAAASLGGVGGLGPSNSNPSNIDPVPEEDSEEESDDTIPEAPVSPIDVAAKRSGASNGSDMPSVPPPDKAEDQQAGPSGQDPSADPLIQTGLGAGRKGLPMGGIAATPAQVGRALKENSCALLCNGSTTVSFITLQASKAQCG